MRNLSAVLVLLHLLVCNRSLSQQAPPFWNEVMQIVRQDIEQPRPRGEILFIGSSTFTLWKNADESFPHKTIVNVGFGGSTLLDQIRYVDYIVTPYRPRQVVIYCGENDFAYDASVTAHEVLDRFKQLTAEIRIRLPEAYITYVSMKPSPSRVALLHAYREGNRLIEAYLKSITRTSYVNSYAAMLDETGNPREDLYREDRLHMNENGYARWKTLLAPHLK